MVDGFNTIEKDLVDDLDRFGMVRVFSRINMKGMGQDGDPPLLMDQLNGAFGAQAGRHELIQEDPDNMVVEGADFLADDDLNPQVGTSEGIFMGAEGAFQRVMVGDCDDPHAVFRSGLNHLAWGVEAVRKISV